MQIWDIFDFFLNYFKIGYFQNITFLNIDGLIRFTYFPRNSLDLLKSQNLGNRFVWERKSSLYKRVDLLNHVWTQKKRYFLANSKVKSFYSLSYNGWHIMSLKNDNFRFYWTVATKNKLWERLYCRYRDHDLLLICRLI